MTDNEFALKVMIKARDVADRASLSFHTDLDYDIHFYISLGRFS